MAEVYMLENMTNRTKFLQLFYSKFVYWIHFDKPCFEMMFR